jgi:hypothetical protein
MKTEPEWVDNLGTGVCPVPADHIVEVRLRKGLFRRDHASSFRWDLLDCFDDILSFRDWTAFEQQEANETIPWNGEGLPTVGTICLAELFPGNWYKIRILLTNPEIDSCIGVILNKNGTYGQVNWLRGFKPITSEEDLAIRGNDD